MINFSLRRFTVGEKLPVPTEMAWTVNKSLSPAGKQVANSLPFIRITTPTGTHQTLVD
jgi:hypothetical protein